MTQRGKHPNSLKALNEHRNRSGQRNKAAVQFSRAIRELMVIEGEKTLTIDGKKHKKIALVVRQLYGKAIGGDIHAAELIFERTEGKIKEQLDVTATVAIKGYCGISPDDWDTVDAGDAPST